MIFERSLWSLSVVFVEVS